MVYSSLSENNLNSMTCFDISDLGEDVGGGCDDGCNNQDDS